MGVEQKDPGSVRSQKAADPGEPAARALVEPPRVAMPVSHEDFAPFDGVGFATEPGGYAANGYDTAPTPDGFDTAPSVTQEQAYIDVPVGDEDEPDPREHAAADVVDFDALNAALGAYTPGAAPSAPVVADSEGRSSATYSSAAPRPVPRTQAGSVDADVPAVIVAPEEHTAPNLQAVRAPAPPNVTVPTPHRPPHPSSPQLHAAGPGASFATEPYVAPPPEPTPHTQPLRRPRTMTVVVREARGPSRLQKAAVFITLLVVFVTGGIAFLIYKPIGGVNLQNLRPGASAAAMAAPTATPAPTPSPTPAIPATPTASASASTSPDSSASASASMAPPVKKAARPPPPAAPSPTASVLH